MTKHTRLKTRILVERVKESQYMNLRRAKSMALIS